MDAGYDTDGCPAGVTRLDICGYAPARVAGQAALRQAITTPPAQALPVSEYSVREKCGHPISQADNVSDTSGNPVPVCTPKSGESKRVQEITGMV